jgi:hypothetical protein
MRAIGSEKISNTDDMLARIMEIAGIKKGYSDDVKPFIGKQSSILHEAVAADGTEFGIVQESKHVYIKKLVNNEYKYMGGVENIHEHSYTSYAEALKHLNLMFKEINEATGQKQNIDILKKKV